jgi:dTDP-4-dehydrorhamnose 3,5-epimerase
MKLIQTPLADCFVLEPTLHKDERGYFFESFNKRVFHALTGFDIEFVQDNQALSQYGTVRGLHFQMGIDAQAKLVRVLQGRVLDVVVDIRPDSATYMQHFSIELSTENNLQLFVPRGFAHGYSVLENNTIFHYKCDNYYNKSAEGGMNVLDKTLQIDWRIAESEMLISEKDRLL